MMTSVNCIFLRFIYDLWHRYWQLVLIVYLQDLLYPHSMSGGYIAIWPCPSVRLSIRSHFRNIYLCFYWKKWFYIWYMAFAWWLVPCLPFPGLPHIYFRWMPDNSARMLRQLGPYYCFIILFNIYMCIIIYLFKRQLLSFSENELFIKW